MRIAIASGKGGTGKTTISSNLAYTEAKKGKKVVYVDCDVEEPNGHLFLKPEIVSTRPVGIMVPSVDQDLCNHCGLCGQICEYSAIVCLGSETLVFPEMCHSCGGCWLVCPENAISQVMKEMGRVEIGRAGSIDFVQGVLNIGEAMSPPVIRAVKKAMPESEIQILDAPPGTSCPVIETIRDCDYLILVTEPTPFGLNDLILAVDMVRTLHYSFGVIINRADLGYSDVQDYCRRQHIPILAEFPDDRRAAEAYSKGYLVSEVIPEFAGLLDGLVDRIQFELESDKVGAS
ncbi:MAG: ATP-binding protein [Candidatus Omnitrophica bacterium]|nr:ATP-binding protein [Candidatus Omnitrophota bacterium]